jgi:hypothetical protein
MDYTHVRSYSFHLEKPEDFVVTVSSEHEVKGIVNVYW